LAIFRAADSVDDLLKACPLKFSIERVQEQDEQPEGADERTLLQEGLGDIEDEEAPRTAVADGASRIDGEELLARPNTLTAHPRTPAYETSDPLYEPRKHKSSPQDEVRPRTEFRVSAEVWLGKHDDYLERSAYWGPFRVDTRSRIQQDLRRRVPLVGLSDIHNLKNYPWLRMLRTRQAEMENRMTVREYSELVKREEVEKINAPANPEGGPVVQDDEGRILTPFHHLLIRPIFNNARRVLDFAEPPGVHQADWEEKVVEAKGKGRKNIGHSILDPVADTAHTRLDSPLPSRPTTSSKPVSASQYGTLVGKSQSDPQRVAAHTSNKGGPSKHQYGLLGRNLPFGTRESRLETTQKLPSSLTASSKDTGLGAQISSFFGLEEEPIPHRYSSLVKPESDERKRRSGKKGRKDRKQTSRPTDIETELRRTDY
jgi:hypothetical protein